MTYVSPIRVVTFECSEEVRQAALLAIRPFDHDIKRKDYIATSRTLALVLNVEEKTSTETDELVEKVAQAVESAGGRRRRESRTMNALASAWKEST